MINPDDARGLGVGEGDLIRLKSRVGDSTLTVQITDYLGEPELAARLHVAFNQSGANYNILSDDAAFDAPSGSATFNGTPVSVEAVSENVGN